MNTMMKVLVVCVCLSLAQVAQAGVVFKGPTTIKNAKIHTVEGELIEVGSVVIDEKGAIAAVGVNVADQGVVIDAAGKVLTPGLVDFITSLGMIEVEAVSGSSDADPGGDKVRAAFRAQDAFNPSSFVIPIQRPGGVTSAVIVPRGGLVSGQSAWVNLGSGRFYGEVVQSPVAMHMGLGQGAAGITGGSRGGVSLAYRELYDDARHFAAKKKDFDRNQSRKLSASRLDLAALGLTFDGKLPVAFNVHRASDILFMLALCEELKLRPIVVGGAEAWVVARELAEAKVPVVLDPMANTPRNFERLGERDDNAARLHAAGVSVIISTFSAHNVRLLRQQAGNAVRAGLPFDAALRAVTLAPAEAAGMGSLYGSIKVGKRANLVLWSGDPFEFSTKVEAMFVEGRKVSLDNRQEQLFERYKTLPRRAAPAPFDKADLAR